MDPDGWIHLNYVSLWDDTIGGATFLTTGGATCSLLTYDTSGPTYLTIGGDTYSL
jgi:hypothetical protein